jgi:predicted nucleotidyltransferase component of viral defense system
MQKNISASVRAKLNNISRSTGEMLQYLMTRYAQERFLYRLGKTEHKESFILKGATLFLLWEGVPHRRTKDIDFLRFGSSDPLQLKKIIEEICTVRVEDDGIDYHADTIEIGPIRENQEYDGYRIVLVVSLGQAQFKLWMDIGFGDDVSPTTVSWPTLLDSDPPQIQVYPQESVIAEKFHAMIEHGMDNSRMKDFFDICHLAQHHSFRSEKIEKAIIATLDRRRIELPDQLPVAFTAEFYENEMKAIQWKAFLNKNSIKPSPFKETVEVVKGFVWPIILNAKSEHSLALEWNPCGPWHEISE